MNKEAFVKEYPGFYKFWAPGMEGSEPKHSDKSRALELVLRCLSRASRANNEYWDVRFDLSEEIA